MDDRTRTMKLMLLLPKVCAARWAGKAARGTSKVLLRQYPNLEPATAAAVVAAFGRTPEPRSQSSDDSSRLKAVKRQLRQGQLRKAAQVLQSDGLAPMDEDGLQRLAELHPGGEHSELGLRRGTKTTFDTQASRRAFRPRNPNVGE